MIILAITMLCIHASPLLDAVESGNLEALNKIIDRGTTAEDLNQALIIAFEMQEWEAAEILISAGADISAVNDELLAIIVSHYLGIPDDLAALVIESGADTSIIDMQTAISLCSAPLVRAVIANGGNVSEPIQDDWGDFPVLIYAVNSYFMYSMVTGIYPSQSFIEVLLEAGANPDEMMEDGSSAMYLSMQYGLNDIAMLLLENGANPLEVFPGIPLLNFAVAFGMDCSFIEEVIERGADVNGGIEGEGYSGYSLAIAIDSGFFDIATLLLEKGADITLDGKEGDDYLLNAVINGAPSSLVSSLIQKGASPDASDAEGKTALYHAITGGQWETASLLAEAGADISKLSPEITDSYRYATSQDAPYSFMKIYGEYGYDLTEGYIERYGIEDALLEATEDNRPLSVIQALVEDGAMVDVYEAAAPNNSPLGNAFWRKNWDTVRYLLDLTERPYQVNGYHETVHEAAVDSDAPEDIMRKTSEMVGTGYMQYGPLRALLEAVKDNADTEEIESLIAQGAYIGSYLNDINSAPLYVAIHKKNWETVLMLIKHGALGYWINPYYPPLGEAVDNEAPVEIIEAMLENGADVDMMYSAMLPLELCIGNRMWDHASLLLANDATVYRYFYELAEERNAPRSFLNQLRAAYRKQGVPMK